MVNTGKVALRDIHIHSFKDINHCKIEGLPQNAPWIFLTGENGMGKTVFLQALAFGLHPIHPDMNSYQESLKNQGYLKVNVHNGRVYGVEKKEHDLKVFGNHNFGWLSCFGPSRLSTLTEHEQNDKIGFNSGVNRLFGHHTFLKNIDFELIKWKLKQGFSESTDLEREGFQIRLEFMKSLFIELLNLADIEIDLDRDIVWYIEKGTDESVLKKVRRFELGAGYRNLIGFVGDMVLNLSANQKEIKDPRKLRGVVIIDEVELHLHPKWQKDLPRILSKHFPDIQFVASTHSPIPILGAPEGSVILKIDRTAENGIEVSRLKKIEQELKFLLPNTIFSSDIFEFNDFGKLEGVRYEDKYDEIIVNDVVRERLEKLKDASDFPDDLFDNE